MIPKIIHYCWFGGSPKPKLAEKCMASWKKYCPDYEIIEWNEGNYDISTAPVYVRQAYAAKKWAFVTDFVRLDVVYNHGGIYLDTDVELLKNIDFLLYNSAYFGFEDEKQIATGLGFGAEKNNEILQELMDDYKDIPFIKANGDFDLTPCPKRNTKIFLKHGLRLDDSEQLLDGKIRILPTTFLCPINDSMGTKTITGETVSIHHFAASWETKTRIIRKYLVRFMRPALPVFEKLLGKELLEKLKEKTRR